MRGATECAKRLKLMLSTLRSKLGKVSQPAITDPITQLILGVLSRDTTESKAQEGLDRLRSMVVDYNELRVIPPIELATVLADFHDARLKCEDISRALNAIFALEHAITLDRLVGASPRDTHAYLERIDGLDPYTRARIRLLGLRQHAVPLDEAMWACARTDHLIDAKCSLHEAQAFLERQIAPEDVLEFVALFRKHAWNEFAAAVRKHELERILSVAPDRTTRNMLRMISMAAAEAAAEPEAIEELEEIEVPLEEGATARKRVKARAGPKAPAARPAVRSKEPKRPDKVEARPKSANKGSNRAKSRPVAIRRAADSGRSRPVSKNGTRRSSAGSR